MKFNNIWLEQQLMRIRLNLVQSQITWFHKVAMPISERPFFDIVTDIIVCENQDDEKQSQHWY